MVVCVYVCVCARTGVFVCCGVKEFGLVQDRASEHALGWMVVFMRVYVYVCVCVCARARVCVFVFMFVGVGECGCTRA